MKHKLVGMSSLTDNSIIVRIYSTINFTFVKLYFRGTSKPINYLSKGYINP